MKKDENQAWCSDGVDESSSEYVEVPEFRPTLSYELSPVHEIWIADQLKRLGLSEVVSEDLILTGSGILIGPDHRVNGNHADHTLCKPCPHYVVALNPASVFLSDDNQSVRLMSSLSSKPERKGMTGDLMQVCNSVWMAQPAAHGCRHKYRAGGDGLPLSGMARTLPILQGGDDIRSQADQ
ncbi:hypothetical protein RJJ37_29710 [Rhizobium redzepovicii]|uniref:Uncharacterized protein n=1 Tax=Rhizobium redzepovicii TaxID=2867518 RepID=A0AAW8PAY2_9HYPH|nr:hypothetical protein [Rhizobium redzepovicii]MDR9763756.1 hypothetical protein [Rhizobium redzepovicii]